ncbi:MAG TPA: periplasmic heavy metal sensor [Thermoanaerobaculia bacterium]|jgi:Spy/CpxP family protein refolding chaperone
MKRTLLILFLSTAALAQQPPQPQDDPIGQQLFPPELIMSQSQKLHLDDKQRATIKTEVQRAQSKFFDLQWELKEASDTMVQLLQQTPVDEAAVLQQADKVMGYEREIKKIHLAMLIRIKNSLTRDQVAELMQMKREMGRRP